MASSLQKSTRLYSMPVANDKGLFPEWKQGAHVRFSRRRASERYNIHSCTLARLAMPAVLPEFPPLSIVVERRVARAADKTFRRSRKYVYVRRSFTRRTRALPAIVIIVTSEEKKISSRSRLRKDSPGVRAKVFSYLTKPWHAYAIERRESANLPVPSRRWD